MMKLILILICVQLGCSYPHGAPNSICTSMIPHHDDFVPKECQSKYVIQSEKSEYNPNEIIRINVRGLTANDFFKGVLLLAKTKNNQQIIGTWSTRDSKIKTVSCKNGTDDNAITHLSSDDKLQIEAFWHAPSIILDENTIIKATIVKSYDEMYVDCFNITLKAKLNNPLPVPSKLTNFGRDIPAKTNTNVTLNYADDTVTVTIATGQIGVNQYRAIGFSLDQKMGDEYVFICVVSPAGVVSLRRNHTKLGKRRPLPTIEEVNVLSTVYENGHATCEFSFETTSEQADGEPAPIVINKNYYLIFSAGILSADEQVVKHNFTFFTSKTYQLQNPEKINLDEITTTTTTTTTVSGGSTSVSSGPIIATTTAPQTGDVGVSVNWTYTNGITNVKMILTNLKSSQWFAIGLSGDKSMGDDHVFVCQHLADGTISLKRLINPGGQSAPEPVSVEDNPGGTFAVIREKIENKKVNCDFTLSNFADMSRRTRQIDFPKLSQTIGYFPLVAIGSLDNTNKMIKHSSSSRTPLDQTVFLNRQEIINYNIQPTNLESAGLMKAHGIIMVFTWIILVSTGILVARYFKRISSDRKICGKAVWFAIHRTIMSCVAILTLIAFVLILVYKKGEWISRKTKHEFAHSIVGILVISFAIIQPFMAIFRCNPDDKYRFIFNYAHAFIGFSAFILSIAAIFLTMFFSQFNFKRNNEWGILVAWSCWLLVVFIIFEIIEIYFRKYSSGVEKIISYDRNDRLGTPTTEIELTETIQSVKKDRIKALFLLLHIIIALGLALALIILIGQT